jgi:hypothetical protein
MFVLKPFDSLHWRDYGHAFSWSFTTVCLSLINEIMTGLACRETPVPSCKYTLTTSDTSVVQRQDMNPSRLSSSPNPLTFHHLFLWFTAMSLYLFSLLLFLIIFLLLLLLLLLFSLPRFVCLFVCVFCLTLTRLYCIITYMYTVLCP